MDEHLDDLEKNQTTNCGHPRSKYAKQLESVQALKFHLQDLHCIEHRKRPKRNRPWKEDGTKPNRAKRPRCARSYSEDSIKNNDRACSEAVGS